jgi:hypothetical protein
MRYSIPLKRIPFKLMQIVTATRLLNKKMNKLRTLWQRTHDDITLRPHINALELETDIKDQVWNTSQRTLQSSLDTTNIKDTCRITKSLTNTSLKTPPLRKNSKIAITNQEKVNTFANTLEEIFTTNSDADPNFTVSTEQVVTEFPKQPNHSEIE